MISLFFAVNSLILILSDRIKTANAEINMKKALVMGLAQAVSILPGVSRSGSTISAGVMAGADREKAIEFSFLMSIPAILSGNILLGSFSVGVINQQNIAGLAASFCFGLFAIKLLISVVKKAGLRYFGYYTLVLAAGNLIWLAVK